MLRNNNKYYNNNNRTSKTHLCSTEHTEHNVTLYIRLTLLWCREYVSLLAVLAGSSHLPIFIVV